MTILFILPLFGAIVQLFTSSKRWALAISILTFMESIRLYLAFDNNYADFQYLISFNWFYKDIVFGIDGISIYFILLTTLLFPICILASWNSIKYLNRQYLVSLLVIEWLLIGVFTVLDILGFYIFYEGVLIPMFFIIGVWGARQQKITAAYYFFFYTLLGSVLMLISIMYIYSITGTTDYITLRGYEMNANIQKLIFLGFVASLAVKIPSFPFHIWLPQAHVEAPVAGSVLLAGVLIKLGSYGIIRYNLALTPIACEYFSPLIITLSILGVIYASLTTIRQTDLKRIIAYSSVGHMGIVTIGIFTLNIVGLKGSIFLQLAHGLVSSALFIVVTMIYERYHTRIVKYYRGLTITMPIYSIYFLIFTLGNIALPGTSNFVGEILAIIGAVEINLVVAILASSGIILSAAYSLFLYNRVAFGGLSSYMLVAPRDLNRREFYLLLPLAVLSIVIGIYPDEILKTIEPSLYLLI
jgi:proton-translocating NADH-quinone oxidoreductase chain M